MHDKLLIDTRTKTYKIILQVDDKQCILEVLLVQVKILMYVSVYVHTKHWP